MIRLLVVAALAAAPMAQAYEFMDTCSGQPTRWARANPNTTWRLSTSYPSADLSASVVGNTLTAAFDEWSAPGCSEFDASRGSDINADPSNSTSNVIGFYESGWPGEWGSNTIAITLVTYSPTSCLLDNADMVFNGVNFRFINGDPSNYSSVDLQSVATHEAGHWLGLNHSAHSGSSLWPSYSVGTDERTLTCDDSEAVCRSHASGSNTCTDDDDCACGVACNNNGVCGGTIPVDPGPGSCDGQASSVNESEPNDWLGEDDVDYYAPTATGDFSISGRTSCGNDGQTFTSDIDWFVIDLPCEGDARFRTSWSGSADLDFYVWDTSSADPFAYSADAGTSGPIEDDGPASGRLYAEVACWEGNSVNYTFTIDFPPYAGDTTPDDPCEGLSWEGECDGDVARWCQDDTIMQQDCSNAGGCGLTEEYGYWCLGEVEDTGGNDSDTGGDDTGDGSDTGGDDLWLPECGSCRSASGAPAGSLALLGFAALIRRRRR